MVHINACHVLHRSYRAVCMLAERIFIYYVNYVNYANYTIYTSIRPSVGPPQHVQLCTADKQLNLEAPMFAHIIITSYFHLRPIFIQILNVLDVYFQRQRFELINWQVYNALELSGL